MMHRVLNSIALLLGLACCAAAFAQRVNSPDYYINRKFWYEPEHDKNVRTEFHRTPKFDEGVFFLTKKTKFQVLGASRGWFQLRLESGAFSSNTAYMPVRLLRSRLYVPTLTESFQESFRRASIFDEDPDIIRKRLEAAGKAPPKPAAPPPWKIRNRGFPPPGSPQAAPALPPETPATPPKE